MREEGAGAHAAGPSRRRWDSWHAHVPRPPRSPINRSRNTTSLTSTAKNNLILKPNRPHAHPSLPHTLPGRSGHLQLRQVLGEGVRDLGRCRMQGSVARRAPCKRFRAAAAVRTARRKAGARSARALLTCSPFPKPHPGPAPHSALPSRRRLQQDDPALDQLDSALDSPFERDGGITRPTISLPSIGGGRAVGGDCSSRGPANFAGCCADKDAQGTCLADSSCRSANACTGGGGGGGLIVGNECASRGPGNFEVCAASLAGELSTGGKRGKRSL